MLTSMVEEEGRKMPRRGAVKKKLSLFLYGREVLVVGCGARGTERTEKLERKMKGLFLFF